MQDINIGRQYSFDSFEITKSNLEIKTDEFDEWFNKYCEGYKRTRTGKRLSKFHWRLDM